MSTRLAYALKEYGASRQEVQNFERRVSIEVERLRTTHGLIAMPDNEEEAFERIAGLEIRLGSNRSADQPGTKAKPN